MFMNDRYRKCSCGRFVVSPRSVAWAMTFQCAMTPGSPRGELAATPPPNSPDDARSIDVVVATIQARIRERGRPRDGWIVEATLAMIPHLSMADRPKRSHPDRQRGRLLLARLGSHRAVTGVAEAGPAGPSPPDLRTYVQPQCVPGVNVASRRD